MSHRRLFMVEYAIADKNGVDERTEVLQRAWFPARPLSIWGRYGPRDNGRCQTGNQSGLCLFLIVRH